MNLCHCLWTPSRFGGFRRSFVIARLACFFAPLSRVRTSSRDPSLYAFHRVLARSLQQVEQFCSVSKRASSMQCARFSLHSDRPLYTCWIMGSRERISRCVNAFGRNGNVTRCTQPLHVRAPIPVVGVFRQRPQFLQVNRAETILRAVVQAALACVLSPLAQSARLAAVPSRSAV